MFNSIQKSRILDAPTSNQEVHPAKFKIMLALVASLYCTLPCNFNAFSAVYSVARTTDTRRLNLKFLAAQIQIPLQNKYLGVGYKGLVFCRNNG